MLFYLYKSPPECMLDLDSVEALILERFQFYYLPAVNQCDTKTFHYYDRISHLILSIIAIEYPYFKETFLKGEIKLFKDKLQVRKGSIIIKELSEAAEYLVTLSQSQEYRILKLEFSKQFKLIQNIIQAVLSKSKHCFKRVHPKTCKKYKLTLPFTALLKLVSKREVEVTNGKVSLSCGQWGEVLEVVFEFLLKIELKLIENCSTLRRAIYECEDDRMRQIIKRFSNVLNGCMDEKGKIVEVDEIDELSKYFPPCMANLHQMLRQTHRLSYDSRYQYTLFLKDIGLSVDNNIAFWENEYQKPCENSTCTHDWKDNQRRYKYQIKHIYGLINSNNVKTSHSCEKFIGTLQSKMDGGCPFQHLSLEQLKEALPESMNILPDIEDIFLYKRNAMPQRACAVYLTCLQKIISMKKMNFYQHEETITKWLNIVSPLQFYNIAKNFK